MDIALKKLYQMRMLSLVFENYAFLIDDFKVALAVVTKAVVFFNLLSVLGISNRVIRNRSASYRQYFIDFRFQWAAQPLGKILSFLAGNRANEGMGRPRGLKRFRKPHLENILPSPF